jgi:hypothetical protein
MTEDEWLQHATPEEMLEFVHGKVSLRKSRLFACACMRWIVFRDLELVWVSEAFADGLASNEDMDTVASKFCSYVYETHWTADGIARGMLSAFEFSKKSEIGYAKDRSQCAAIWERKSREMASLIRDIFGNPFRPVAVDPCWLTLTVLALGQVIYDQRAFERMPELGEALERAGCSNKDILDHCRQPSEHVRGCWLVDLILGKN